MDSVVIPHTLAHFCESEIFNILQDKHKNKKKNLNVNDTKSVYGKTAECLTKTKTSSIEERKYLHRFWLAHQINIPTKADSIKKQSKRCRQKSFRNSRSKGVALDGGKENLNHKPLSEEEHKIRQKKVCQTALLSQIGICVTHRDKAKRKRSPPTNGCAKKKKKSLKEKITKTICSLTDFFKGLNTHDAQKDVSSLQIENSEGNDGESSDDEMDTISHDTENDPILTNMLVDYNNRINKFPTYECPICRRYVYQIKDSTRNIIVSSTILSEFQKLSCDAFYEGQILRVCRRCHSSLEKKKIPAMAFMNNMEIHDYPKELTELNHVETRLISQIKPFMKIYTLNKGRGQMALKGSCIHFPQNVAEVIENLPISPNNSDVIIINETNETGSKLPGFSVRSDKLYPALMWLKQNNHLYKHVQMNDVPEEQLQITEIQPAQSNNNNDNETEELSSSLPANGFNLMTKRRAILHADFHQASSYWFPDGGTQCGGMCASAIVHAYIQPCRTWTSSTMNTVLLAGNKYYNEIAPRPGTYLESSEVGGIMQCFGNEVQIEVTDEIYAGCLNKIPGNQLTRINNSIEEFIESEFNSAILTTGGSCVAFIKDEDNLYLFDSHSRGLHGWIAPLNGKACLIKCPISTSSEYFSKLIHRNLQPTCTYSDKLTDHEKRGFLYTLRPIRCFFHNKNGNCEEEEDQPSGVQLENQDEMDNLNLPSLNITQYVQANSRTNTSNLDCVIRMDQPVEPHLDNYLEHCKQPAERELDLFRERSRPLHPDKERRLEELAFIQALPYGKNGFSEERKIPITHMDYYQARVMGSNHAFHSNDYLFYGLSRVEADTAQRKISICGNMTTEEGKKNGGDDYVKGLENVHLYMSSIRGSSSYWKKYTGDVLAMIGMLGTPSFFLTITYDDLNSKDCLTALWKAAYGPDTELPCDPSEIPYETRRDLLNANPVASARHFNHKMNVILDIIKKQSMYLFGAPMQDFTYRVEFQGRGSPHVHMLLWLEGVPDWNTEEGKKFIEQNVSCSLDVPYKDMVVRYQNHHHTKTCFKKNKICRFGFPRKPCMETTVLDDEQIAKNYGRFVDLKRTKDEININNYHPKLLQILKSNMDIQAVTGTRAIAFYIGKYMSKSEPTHLREEIRKAIENFKTDSSSSYYQKAMIIASKLISQREVSAPEAAYRLCHLALRRSSRSTVFIPTFQPHKRIRHVRKETMGNEEPKFGLNIIDRYINRPDNDTFRNMCLLEFAANYVPARSKQTELQEDDLDEYDDENNQENSRESKRIQLINNKGCIHKRKKAAVIKYPLFNPIEFKEDHLYSMILLHYPFREENFLVGSDGKNRTITQAFQALSSEFRTNADDPLIKPDLVNKINEVIFLLGDQEEDDNDEYLRDREADYNIFFDDAAEVLQENEVFVADPQLSGSPSNNLQERIHMLNSKQKEVFEKVRKKILSGDSQPQLLEYVAGSAGSGKSFLIKALTLVIQALLPGNTLIKCAPSGIAARSIAGSTLHKTFSLGVERNGIAPYFPLGGKKLHERRLMFKDVKFIFIDEISMVSYEVFRTLHLRLGEIFDKPDLPFGGVNIVLFGDLAQLDPCRGHWIFDKPSYFSCELDLWRLFQFNELQEVVRQTDADPLTKILQRLRIGTLQQEDLDKLHERVLDPMDQTYSKMLEQSEQSLHLYPKVKMVAAYNDEKMEQLQSSGTQVYKINSLDTFACGDKFGLRAPEHFIPKDFRKCGGIPTSILLGMDCKVMLRYNADVSGGLVNGSMGIVKGIQWTAFRRDQLEDGDLPQGVMVKFDGYVDPRHFSSVPGFEECVEVGPKNFEFVGNRGARICRRQIPLVLCFSTSIHKAQGMGLPSATIHLGRHIFKKGMAYVALSRLTKFLGLFITELDSKKLLVNKKGQGPANEKAMRELYSLKLRDLVGEVDEELFCSLLEWSLEYIMCNTCGNWNCLCNC